jgi:hypothetical protein
MKTVIKSTLGLNLIELRDRKTIEIVHDNGDIDGIYFSEHDGTSIEPVADLINRLVLPKGGELNHHNDPSRDGTTRDQVWITYYDEDLDLSEFDGTHYEFEYTEEGDPEDPDHNWYLILGGTRYSSEEEEK